MKIYFRNVEGSKKDGFFALPLTTGKPYRPFEESSVIFFLWRGDSHQVVIEM
jgi:hypothetical protein